MKKVLLAIALLLSITTFAQKKSHQWSFRTGYDQAQKLNYTHYAKSKWAGLDVGASFDKYWNWYGVGIDADFLKNAGPSYAREQILEDSIFKRSGSGFLRNTHYTIASSNKGLTRGFVGIGPSFKYSNATNKIVVELNARAGITYTDGGALLYTTDVTPAFNIPFFQSHLTRTGPIPPTLALSSWTFKDDGYSQDLLQTIKLQLRANYYIKPNLGINIGAYYFNYQGSKTRYDYVAFEDIGQSYWNTNIIKVDLAPLQSYGVTAGVTYRIMKNNKPAAPKAAKVQSSASIIVKDELTGQPIRNAEVTITNATGKTYTAYTNENGVATFEKIENGTYAAKGLLNGIATNESNFTVAKNKGTTTLTHNDPRFTVLGKAVNLSTNAPEGDVMVTLNNSDKGSVKMATTKNGSGSFTFQIDGNTDYTLSGKKDSYISNIEKVSTKGLTRSQTLYVELAIGIEKVEVGKTIALNNIYYDVNKSNIREEASSDLQKLVTFLQDNPNINIEINSHTDSQGAEDYNLKLSQDRAQNVVNYLTNKGINASRLKAKGFGETRLKVNCTSCTEEQHQQNRRTEFVVIN